MIGEQYTRHNYIGLKSTDIVIQMNIQIEVPGDPYAAVSIEMNLESTFPENLSDEVGQRLRNGVHGGLSLSGFALLRDSIVVRILELSVSPSPQNFQELNDRVKLGYLLEVTVSGVVESLLRNMQHLSTGEESYHECELPPEESSDDSSFS